MLFCNLYGEILFRIFALIFMKYWSIIFFCHEIVFNCRYSCYIQYIRRVWKYWSYPLPKGFPCGHVWPWCFMENSDKGYMGHEQIWKDRLFIFSFSFLTPLLTQNVRNIKITHLLCTIQFNIYRVVSHHHNLITEHNLIIEITEFSIGPPQKNTLTN